MSGNGRETVEAACAGIVRRVVSLPRSIIGGVSRAMGHGIKLIGIGPSTTRHHHHHLPPPLPPPQDPTPGGEKWALLNSFETEYGSVHPFFFACRFSEALKMSEEEGKLTFVYLHSPDHPFTAEFCRDTLCSEVIIPFLDVNFVSWAGIQSRGEGYQVAAMLRPASFPFCAVVAPASGDSIAVLQQIEGPVSPAALVEILQGTVEEQGLAFGSSRAKEEDKRRADRCRLQGEQDAAYLAALKIDTELERLKNLPSVETLHRSVEAPNKPKPNPSRIEVGKMKQATTGETQNKEKGYKGKGPKDTRILIRFPNGERREGTFSRMDKIQSVYEYIDSMGLPGVGNYQLISSFPRRVFGLDQIGMTLKDAGLHPRASLFVELL